MHMISVNFKTTVSI